MDEKREYYQKLNEIRQIPLYFLKLNEIEEYIKIYKEIYKNDEINIEENLEDYQKEYEFRKKWENYIKDKEIKDLETAYKIGENFWKKHYRIYDIRVPMVYKNRSGIVNGYIIENYYQEEKLHIKNLITHIKLASAHVEEKIGKKYEPTIILPYLREGISILGDSAQLLIYLSIIYKGKYNYTLPPWITLSCTLNLNKSKINKVENIKEKIEAAKEQGITIFGVSAENYEEAVKVSENKIYILKLDKELNKIKNIILEEFIFKNIRDNNKDNNYNIIKLKKDYYMDQRKYNEAIEYFKLKLQNKDLYPTSKFLLFLGLLESHLHLGKTQEANIYIKKCNEIIKKYPEKFIPSSGLEYWVQAHINFPLFVSINYIDFLELDISLENVNKVIDKVNKILELEENIPSSIYHFYNFISLNTKARILNYKGRLETNENYLKQSLELLFKYNIEDWALWERKNFPNTSVNRQRNTIIEFSLALIKNRLLYKKDIKDIKEKVSNYIYEKKEIKDKKYNLDETFDVPFGILWLTLIEKENPIELLSYRDKHIDDEKIYDYPYDNILCLCGEWYWKNNEKEKAIKIWETLKEKLLADINNYSILHLLACRPLLYWAKNLKKENQDITEPINKLNEIKQKIQTKNPNSPLIKKWDLFFKDITPNSSYEDIVKAELKIYY